MSNNKISEKLSIERLRVKLVLIKFSEKVYLTWNKILIKKSQQFVSTQMTVGDYRKWSTKLYTNFLLCEKQWQVNNTAIKNKESCDHKKLNMHKILENSQRTFH